MNIRKTIITTAVALTTVALIAPASVGAVTIAELQAQINALNAQLAALQGQSSPGNTPAACVGITFSRNLRVGLTGSDVKCLQVVLNTNGYTVSASGAGSAGNETTYFGSRTLAAVRAYQSAQGFTPANQVGPLTRAKLNAGLGVASPTPSTPSTPSTPVPTGAGLSVMLASDNPVAGTVVDASALHSMMKLVFTNGDNAEVKITGLKLKRIGVSADASVTNTYLFKGAERLTDGAAVSTTVVNFNNSSGLFTVPAGGSVNIDVISDVDGSASETVGMQVVASADIASNASSVKGTFPISGNLMTIATGTLAGVSFNTTTTPAAASIDPQDDYTVWQNSTTITTRAVDFKRISFKKTGSAKNSDLKDFELFVDGVKVGTTQQLSVNAMGDNVATFDLTGSPKKLETGTRVIKLNADIQGGSNLNFTMDLWNVADATFVDSQYIANVLAQANSAAFTKRSTGQQTINAGTLTVSKLSSSPSGDIVDGAASATLAKFELKAAGEKVKVESLIVSAVVSTAGVGSLRNGMLLANGVQVGSTATLNDNGAATASTTYNFGSSLIVEPGSPVTLEVRTDVFDNDGTNSIVAGTTIAIRLEGASTNNNATGMVSSTTIDVPSTDTDANTLTVRQGSLTLSKYTAYTDHSVVAPLTTYKLGHFTLTAATSEAVNVTAINVTPDEVSSYMTNLYVKYGSQTTTVKPTVVATANSWSINYILPAGQTIDVEVYANIASGMTTGTGTVDVDIDGTTASSAVTSDSSSVTGQALTYTSGSLATAFDGSPQNQAISGNQSVLAGRFKLTSSYQKFTVSEMRFTANSNPSPISSATLKDNATGATLATVPYDNTNSYFNFTGLGLVIPASTTKRVDVYWNLGTPSATNSSWNLDTKAALTYVKYLDPNGTESTDTNTRTGNSTIAYAAVPKLTSVDLSNTVLANGAEREVYKFTLNAPSQSSINVKQFKLNLNWSDGGTADNLELEGFKLFKDGIDITSSVSMVDEDQAASMEATTGTNASEAVSQIIIRWDGTTEDTISAGTSTAYSIKATPQGFGLLGATDTAKDIVAVEFVADTAAQTATYNFLNEGTSLTTIVKLFSSATANASAENANLLWSDGSAVAHSASTTAGTKDWTNSYLILDDLIAESWADR